MVKRLEIEGRHATKSEQEQLAKYVGWGTIRQIFPDSQGNYAKGWETLGAKLKELLTDTEYRTASRSNQYAFYTSETVVRANWNGVEQLGFDGGLVFERAWASATS